jgi:endonuclease/exonuclease/phosphatase family metal-dependent hydrolase
MLFKSQALRCVGNVVFSGALFFAVEAAAQSNLTLRVMAANITSGNNQSYETPGINIFKGLKPDVVAIQEFQYNSNSDSNSLRTLVDAAFGPGFSFYCEPGYNIPNGIVSRWPIVAAGTVPSPEVGDRGFAWAQIALPGTNSLYVVSVHLYGSGSASQRNNEAMTITNLMATNFPPGAWIIVGGDFNTDSRSEACVTTFKSRLSDSPIPTDLNGDPDSNRPRNKPYDYVLPSFSLTNALTPVVLPSHTLTNGLVFVSTNYIPLSDVPPVQYSDSDANNMQHMAIIKDFTIPIGMATNPPAITAQPQGQTNAVGATISFYAGATGSGTLAYQWRFNGTNLSGATTNPYVLVNGQLTNNGDYSVIVTNLFGSVTSSNAALLLTNAPPAIATPPQNQSVLAGSSATFSVAATGTPPLYYQWRFNGTNLSGATTNPFALANVQLADGGYYSVVVTNFVGSVTSSAAALTVLFTNPVVFAQWNFNSVPADATTTTGTTAPSIGSGTATLVGGVTTNNPGFATGDTALDPAPSGDNTAWNTTGYPASGNNKTAGAQFAVSTAGKQNIVISWGLRSSNTGGKYFRLQYSTNSGAGFADFPAAVTVTNVFNDYTNDLSAFPGVNNNSNFVFRIVAEFQSTATGSNSAAYVAANAGSTYASSGTTRFDMVGVSGISYIAPAAPALTQVGFANGQFQFTVSGSAGADYIVQTATNLAAPDWISVFTNVSPFIYTNANPTVPQQYYRAAAQP